MCKHSAIHSWHLHLKLLGCRKWKKHTHKNIKLTKNPYKHNMNWNELWGKKYIVLWMWSALWFPLIVSRSFVLFEFLVCSILPTMYNQGPEFNFALLPHLASLSQQAFTLSDPMLRCSKPLLRVAQEHTYIHAFGVPLCAVGAAALTVEWTAWKMSWRVLAEFLGHSLTIWFQPSDWAEWVTGSKLETCCYWTFPETKERSST